MFRIEIPAGAFGRGMAVEEFRDHFIALCEEHQRDRRALIFGAILYSYKDAEVIKALEDRVYWNALNELSGRYATIFVFYSPLHHQEAPNAFWDHAAKEAQDGLTELSQCFLKGEAFTLPAVLFFQVEDGSVIDGVAVTLRSERTEDSFLEMKQIIRTVTNALRQVKEENRMNAGPIFELVKNALASRALGLTLRRWAKNAIDMIRLARLFTGVAGS